MNVGWRGERTGGRSLRYKGRWERSLQEDGKEESRRGGRKQREETLMSKTRRESISNKI